MKNDSQLLQFIRDNFWNLAVLIVGIAIAYTALNAQVDAIAETVDKNEQKISSLADLVSRVIVLEEKDKSITDDILEMKQDLKDIKRHFEIQP